MIKEICKRIDDSIFLWDNSRKESAFLLILVAVASISRIRYPDKKDGDAFREIIKDFRTTIISIEYNGKLESVEQIFYKWIRYNLVHEGGLPSNIEFQENEKDGFMSIRAGGAPEYVLKVGSGWFYHFVDSLKKSKEISEINI